MDKLLEFVEKYSMPGKTLFAKVWGSRSHNTNFKNSDWDFAGVYVAPTSKMLTTLEIEKAPDCKVQTDKKNKDLEPDFQFYELGKFCNLLIKGNPTIIDYIFTEKLYICDESWKELLKNRIKFLSRKVVHEYLGYVEGQLNRLKTDKSLHTKGGQYTEKWAYHALRVLGDCFRIVKGQEPVVWKTDDEQEFLMRVRNYNYSQYEIEEMISDKIERIKFHEPYGLPDFGDMKFLDEWQLKIRKNYW